MGHLLRPIKKIQIYIYSGYYPLPTFDFFLKTGKNLEGTIGKKEKEEKREKGKKSGE